MLHHHKLISAVFITFSGDCKKALQFYQTCFGGSLSFETFETGLKHFKEMPVVSGSLVSERIIIYGSDMVHNEGRKTGNHISIYLQCHNTADREELINKLQTGKKALFFNMDDDNQKLIEVSDAFDVRWVLAI